MLEGSDSVSSSESESKTKLRLIYKDKENTASDLVFNI